MPSRKTSKSKQHDNDCSLRLVIEEQRRDYDYLLRIYERAGAKENVLLAAAFGVIVYLYSAPTTDQAHSIVARLSVPQQDYGLVIYVLAAGLFLFGLFKLMLNVFGGNDWETAYESSKQTYGDICETEAYVKDRYDKAHVTNIKSYNKRRSDLRLCFYCLLISAIILIVTKTLQ